MRRAIAFPKGDENKNKFPVLMVCFQLLRLQCLAIVILSFTGCNCLKYALLKEANASCFPKDSCRDPDILNVVEERNCDCDSSCLQYNTCCVDSPYLNYSRRSYRKISCRTTDHGRTNVFMVDRCAPSYEGPQEIRKRCEDESVDWSDPVPNSPVTNVKSRITYKSLLCAICNSEKPQDLTMWQLMLDCSTLGEFRHVCTKNRDFVLKNIMFIEDKGLWGLWSWDRKSDWKFRFLPIVYKLPDEIKDSVQECRQDLVSFCPGDWTDSSIRRYCESYMGAIYFPHNAFRNIHCAICNRVKNFTELSCNPLHSSPFRTDTALSFGLLLDVDLKDGDTVGSTDGCSTGQVHDPFAKKCRTIECPIPGYTLKNGRCAKE